MQIVSLGDGLHEVSRPNFWGKIRKYIISLSSAKLAQKEIKIK